MPESKEHGITRRKRYERLPSQEKLIGLTPTKLRMLRYLAEMRFLSLPQLAYLCCPAERQNLSEKAARRHLRMLFDAGLVDVLPVSRMALATPDAANDASLLYGSAPNVYVPTAGALKLLYQADLIDEERMNQKPLVYGPKNSLFLAHELAVRDVRVWLETMARAEDHEMKCWQDGVKAVISLDREHAPQEVRPDCWFVYQMREVVLVGLVEVDRGTERGDQQWAEKMNSYSTLFADRGALRAATGYVNARVLVFCPDGKRCDRLGSFVARYGEATSQRFWFTEKKPIIEISLETLCWHRPSDHSRHALVPARDAFHSI